MNPSAASSRLLTKALLLCIFGFMVVQSGAATEHELTRRSVGFYILVKANLDSERQVGLFGYTNLPPGAILGVAIYDRIGTGSIKESDDLNIVVPANGVFRADLKPKQDHSFQRSMVCSVSFMPTYPKQPPSVLTRTGDVGEFLGESARNPQINASPRVKFIDTLTVVQ